MFRKTLLALAVSAACALSAPVAFAQQFSSDYRNDHRDVRNDRHDFRNARADGGQWNRGSSGAQPARTMQSTHVAMAGRSAGASGGRGGRR